MTAFQIQTAHSAQQAMTPGWWAYAQARVTALEADQAAAGLYTGLRAAVGASIRAAGYRPAAHELGQWWIFENKVPVLLDGQKSVKGRHDA